MRKLGLIGVGKLGLPYALCFGSAGINVKASSYKQEYIDALQYGKFHSTEPGVNELYLQVDNVRYTIDNHEVIEYADMIYIMVATPSNEDGFYDVSAIWDVIEDFLSYNKSLKGKILIVGSTVNPGDCVKFQHSLTSLGVRVVYCPTFVAQGTVLTDIREPHTLSIGTSDPDAFDQCRDLFETIITPDTPTFNLHTTTGEILKLAGNCRATMEIVFFNLMGEILQASGMQQDISKANQYLNFVKKSARWSFGFGYGGPCYPRDNRTLVEYSKQINVPYVLGSVIDQANDAHSEFLYRKFKETNTQDLPYYFDHVSYKPDVALFEESQQLNLAEKFLQDGCKVYIKPTVWLTEEIKSYLKLKYPGLVDFLSIEELNNNTISFFEIGFNR